MTAEIFKPLYDFSGYYSDNPALLDLVERLDEKGSAVSDDDRLDEAINIYRQALPAIEQALWSSTPDIERVSAYQQVFNGLEHLLGLKGNDRRHSFIIVIPVADRPKHLAQCLDSLLKLCRFYCYGGYSHNRYGKIHVVVADDSKHAVNMQQHRSICDDFCKQGLETEYFGKEQQLALIAGLDSRHHDALSRIVGHYIHDPEPAAFFHKGASITRNITYLRLKQITGNSSEKQLIHFIDSDQEFRIRLDTGNEDDELYAINYFYHLDEIFSRPDIGILTGKVVGDPPVSPSVMAANFQDDVIAFLQQLASLKPSDACRFHGRHGRSADEASYHDMASMFGFDNADTAFDFRCEISSPHDHVACFENFAAKLNRFFDGEHPTRITFFNHESAPGCSGFTKTAPARTVYTGNYIFRPEYLEYFIAFATLKLRMAGPALGRLIKSEIGQWFVSANLPLLHKRTIDTTGESEFRPGVSRTTGKTDLSGEFERQFYGDIMLFTIEKLTELGYPKEALTAETIQRILCETTDEIRNNYETRHDRVLQKLDTLKTLFCDSRQWWHNEPSLENARSRFTAFMSNIEYNFGNESRGREQIHSIEHQHKRHNEMLDALINYESDRIAWRSVLK